MLKQARESLAPNRLSKASVEYVKTLYNSSTHHRLRGQLAPAAEEAKQARKHCSGNGSDLFEIALQFARLVPLVGNGKTQLTGTEKAERQQYADLTLETLRRAVNSGFRSTSALRQHHDLQFLRGDGRLQQLIVELDSIEPEAKE